MISIIRILVVLIGLAWLSPATAQPASADGLRAAISDVSAPAPELAAFYEGRHFEPAWLADGRPTTQALALVEALSASEAEGLRPADYHADELRRLTAPGRRLPAGGQARLDLLLSDAFFRYARDLQCGRVRPGSLYSDWDAHPRDADFVRLLGDALRSEQVGERLASLRPLHAGYRRLTQALARYRDLAERGGWPALEPGPALRLGGRDDRVAALRRRLRTTDDLPAAADTGTAAAFDAAVDAAVQGFQTRHGLEADGVVGPRTLAALNVPAAERVLQIVLNLERWRWLQADLGRRHVLIDVPGYRLDFVEDGRVSLRMKVIVGTRQTPSPVFTSEITDVVMSPYWHVPYSIVTAEILPQLRRSSSYLARHHMTLLRNGRRVDPATVNWSAVSARRFPYQIRQDPGPDNPLGPVKFIFENRFGVRLHGTSNPELFARTDCALSHGCIRAERPINLAAALLEGDAAWTVERIEAAVATGRETWVALPEPVPIHVLYWTAWVDEGETIHFYPDLYGRDPPLDDALGLSYDSSDGFAGHPPDSREDATQ